MELQLTIPPHHFQVWPPTAHTSHALTDGVFVLYIPSIAAKEKLSVELLNVNDKVPDTIRVKSKAAEARFVPMTFSRAYPAYINMLLLACMMLGCFYALKLLIGFVLQAAH